MAYAEKKNVRLLTEYKESEVIVGAEFTISVADARGILDLTRMDVPENGGDPFEEQREMLFVSRDILRKIAKAVLYTTGDTTSRDDLIKLF